MQQPVDIITLRPNYISDQSNTVNDNYYTVDYYHVFSLNIHLPIVPTNII